VGREVEADGRNGDPKLGRRAVHSARKNYAIWAREVELLQIKVIVKWVLETAVKGSDERGNVCSRWTRGNGIRLPWDQPDW
jgi:hypothetical protein